MGENIFGIDLGTTNSSIALYENDDITILKNIEGSEITPSVIFFNGINETGEDDILVGEFAKNAEAQVVKGNKAAGARARKAALEIMKDMKEFRKVSVEASK